VSLRFSRGGTPGEGTTLASFLVTRCCEGRFAPPHRLRVEVDEVVKPNGPPESEWRTKTEPGSTPAFMFTLPGLQEMMAEARALAYSTTLRLKNTVAWASCESTNRLSCCRRCRRCDGLTKNLGPTLTCSAGNVPNRLAERETRGRGRPRVARQPSRNAETRRAGLRAARTQVGQSIWNAGAGLKSSGGKNASWADADELAYAVAKIVMPPGNPRRPEPLEDARAMSSGRLGEQSAGSLRPYASKPNGRERGSLSTAGDAFGTTARSSRRTSLRDSFKRFAIRANRQALDGARAEALREAAWFNAQRAREEKAWAAWPSQFPSGNEPRQVELAQGPPKSSHARMRGARDGGVLVGQGLHIE